MTVDREEASALLADVQGIEARIHELLIYSRVSDYLFLWGTIFLVGFTATFFLRDASGLMWWGLEALGLIGTVAIVAMHGARRESRNPVVLVRAAFSVVAVVAFGSLWIALAHMGWREQVTFWPSLLSFLLFMIGLWVGRSLAIAGFAIFVVTLAGYFVAGDYLHLWMAAAAGGSMIAGGFWLRR
jgi:hypothetical protein